jgi:hypothetical protein
VVGVAMIVRVRVPRAVGMGVLVLMKDDFEPPAKDAGNAAQRLHARQVIAAFQSRDHRFGHAQPFRKLALGLTALGAQFEQLSGALRCNRGAIGHRSGWKGFHSRSTWQMCSIQKLSNFAKPGQQPRSAPAAIIRKWPVNQLAAADERDALAVSRVYQVLGFQR